jgi:ubiquinone/menaquinone biosynthesis C-methylase UbiE
MQTDHMRDKEVLAKQYQDSSNLDIRKKFHQKYSRNSIEYGAWLLSKIEFFKGCRILEVGCGSGDLWEDNPALVDTFSELVLTDLSEGMIEIVKKSYAGRKNVQIQVMDVVDMPFEDRCFDVVVANSMLYHVNDLDTTLKNIHRVLRDGGKFYATTFGKNGLLSYIQAAMFEMGLSDSKNVGEISFALENGADILRNHFSTVQKEIYPDDHIEVSDCMDLVDYIFSMASMSHVDHSNRDRIQAYFEAKRDRNGVLVIPKLAGMFVAVK